MSKQNGDESAFGVAAGSPDPTAIYAAADALSLIWLPAIGAVAAAAVTIANHQSVIARCKAQAACAMENAEWERRMAALYSANTQDQPRGANTSGKNPTL